MVTCVELHSFRGFYVSRSRGDIGNKCVYSNTIWEDCDLTINNASWSCKPRERERKRKLTHLLFIQHKTPTNSMIRHYYTHYNSLQDDRGHGQSKTKTNGKSFHILNVCIQWLKCSFTCKWILKHWRWEHKRKKKEKKRSCWLVYATGSKFRVMI